jgi:hypothetical protein
VLPAGSMPISNQADLAPLFLSTYASPLLKLIDIAAFFLASTKRLLERGRLA